MKKLIAVILGLLIALPVSPFLVTGGVLLLSHCRSANAADPIDYATLYTWSGKLSRYVARGEPPPVTYRQIDFFDCTRCGAPGGYYEAGEIIIESRALALLDRPKLEALIVHEMVHYLQDQSGLFDDSCASRRAQEYEAYYIQRQYLLYAHGIFAMIYPPVKLCDG